MKSNIHTNYIQGLVDGESEVLHYIYKTYLPKVTRWVNQNHGSEADGFDVFQDTLEVLVSKSLAGELKAEVPFQAYLFSITRNKWISRLREKKKEELVRNEEFERYTTINYEEHFEHENQSKVKQMMTETLHQLSPLCQQLIPLVEGKVPAKEIAEELDMTNANAVHRRKFACFESWKKRIMKHEYYPIWQSMRS